MNRNFPEDGIINKILESGSGYWTDADNEVKHYSDMSHKHIRGCIDMMEHRTKKYHGYSEEETDILTEKINEMRNYLKNK